MRENLKNRYGELVNSKMFTDRCCRKCNQAQMILSKSFYDLAPLTLFYCNIWTFRKSLCKTAWVEIAQKTSKQVLDTSKRISIESLSTAQQLVCLPDILTDCEITWSLNGRKVWVLLWKKVMRNQFAGHYSISQKSSKIDFMMESEKKHIYIW